MKKILLLCGKNNIQFPIDETKCIKDDLYKYSEDSLLFRFIRKYLPYKVKWYCGKWINTLDDFSNCIIFDSTVKYEVIEYISDKLKIRPVLYYRNQINSNHNLDINKVMLKADVWTYNLSDCMKYKVKYNPQVTSKKLLDDFINKEIIYDITFIGTDKNRKKLLNELELKFSNFGLGCNFKIINNKAKQLSYHTYLDIISKSKCILDLVSENNYGLTLRVLEALFLDKKLITNYELIKNYPFYNENNIFVIGKRNINELPLFLKEENVFIPDSIKMRYDVGTWINRFIEDNPESVN